VRVLTVRQPWAWAIVHGGKDVENRSRNIAGSYRGPVAIHAGKELDAPAWESPIVGLGFRRACRASTTFDELRRFCDNATTFGAVIGVVDLTGVHGPASSRCCGSPWAEEGTMHLLVENPRPLRTPVPARGMLGLWRPDADLEHAIREQLPT